MNEAKLPKQIKNSSTATLSVSSDERREKFLQLLEQTSQNTTSGALWRAIDFYLDSVKEIEKDFSQDLEESGNQKEQLDKVAAQMSTYLRYLARVYKLDAQKLKGAFWVREKGIKRG